MMRLATVLAVLVAALSARAEIPPPGAIPTSVLTTPRFRIRHTPRAEGAARMLARGTVEGIRDEVEAVLGRDWPGVTEVRVGAGREEYEALAVPGGRPPGWAVALAYPALNVVLVESRSLLEGDGQETLRHELVHVALGQLGEGWPRWFQEGLAIELTGERKYRSSQFNVLSRAVAQDRLMAFEDLAHGFPDDPADVEVAYAQSAAFVEFLRRRHGAAGFARLIDGVHQGRPFETAFGIAFRSPLSLEEKVFRERLPSRYPWWAWLAASGEVVLALGGALLVAGFLRRRAVVRARREEQSRVERLEDVGLSLVESAEASANDDGAPPEPGPWTVHAVRVVQGRAGAHRRTGTT